MTAWTHEVPSSVRYATVCPCSDAMPQETRNVDMSLHGVAAEMRELLGQARVFVLLRSGDRTIVHQCRMRHDSHTDWRGHSVRCRNICMVLHSCCSSWPAFQGRFLPRVLSTRPCNHEQGFPGHSLWGSFSLSTSAGCVSWRFLTDLTEKQPCGHAVPPRDNVMMHVVVSKYCACEHAKPSPCLIIERRGAMAMLPLLLLATAMYNRCRVIAVVTLQANRQK
jgi:hypothetical protein